MTRVRVLLGLGLLVTLVGTWGSWRFGRAYLGERSVLNPAVGRVPLPADSLALGLTALTVSNGAEQLAVWYAPRTTGGTIVLCSGTNSNRASLLNEARALISGGHGVVLFDWPGHGESSGGVELGEPARRALRALLDEVLSGDPPFRDVDPLRVGVFAFSFGGVTAVPVVARDTRIRSLVVVAAPLDPWEQTQFALRGSGWFGVQGGLWFWSRRGEHFEDQRLAPVAGLLAPRPVLVIAGDQDRVVDPADAAALVRLVGPSAALWRIEGAGHGGYAEEAPDYGTRLARFYERTLAPEE